MVRPPVLKPKEVEAIILKKGFLIKRQTGSHRVYYHPISNFMVVIPFHSKDIPNGTLRSIIRQSGLPLGVFRK